MKKWSCLLGFVGLVWLVGKVWAYAQNGWQEPPIPCVIEHRLELPVHQFPREFRWACTISDLPNHPWNPAWNPTPEERERFGRLQYVLDLAAQKLLAGGEVDLGPGQRWSLRSDR